MVPNLSLMQVSPLQYMPREPRFSAGNPTIDGFERGQEMLGREQDRESRAQDAETRRRRAQQEAADAERARANEQGYRDVLGPIVANPNATEDQIRQGVTQAEVRYGDPTRAAETALGGFDDGRTRELEILKMADSNPQLAAEIARREGIDIPEQFLTNATARNAVLMAHDLGYADPAQAAQFTQALLGNGGNVQAAMQTAGPARPKPVAYKPPAYKLEPVMGPDGKLSYASWDPSRGTLTPIGGDFTPAPKPGGGGSGSVYEQKRQAWLALYPGDQAGALEYAGGRSRISDAELRTKAMALAQEQWKSTALAGDQPPTTAELQAKAEEIVSYYKGLEQADPSSFELGLGGGFDEGGVYYPITQEDYDAIPSGGEYIDPEDGETHIKP